MLEFTQFLLALAALLSAAASFIRASKQKKRK
jgi:hypothetical protein